MDFLQELIDRSKAIHIIYPDKSRLFLEKTKDNFLVSDTENKDFDTVPFQSIYKFADFFMNQDDLEILFIAHDGEIFEHVKPVVSKLKGVIYYE